MKKWKILLNIIMELLVFFGMAMILIFGIPKLMGFFLAICSQLDIGVISHTVM